MKRDDLKIRMRVISKCKIGDWFDKIGTITKIESNSYQIKFDNEVGGYELYYHNVSYGSPVDQSLEKYIPDDLS